MTSHILPQLLEDDLVQQPQLTSLSATNEHKTRRNDIAYLTQRSVCGIYSFCH